MSGWYGPGKQHLAGAGNWLTAGAFRAVVIDEAQYTYARTHASLTQVPAGSRISDVTTLTGTTITAAGELDCDDFTISGLDVGDPDGGAILIYAEGGGTDATRIPILYIDEKPDTSALQIIPNGGDWTFQVPNASPFLGAF